MIEAPPLVPHIVLEVELRVPVAIPRLLVTEAMDKDPDELSGHQLRELVRDDPDRLQDAIDDYLSDMPEFDVVYDDDVDRPLPESFKTFRPEGGRYEGPAPSFLERLNLQTNLLSEFSPANGLSDEQARGALWALRQTWNLPTMNRRQRDRLVLFLSELEWVCCARPSLHFFLASDEDATICSYCGTGEPGHDVRRSLKAVDGQAEESNVDQAEAESQA